MKLGDEWNVRLRLFGEGRGEEVGHLERALAAIGDLPIGAECGRVELKAITQFVAKEYVVSEKVESGGESGSGLRGGESGAAEPGGGDKGRLTVRFETPVRFKREGQALAPNDLDFMTLFDQVWRRLTIVCALYGQYSPQDDAAFRRLRERASSVNTVERRLRPMRWEHLSVESGIQKPMRGLIGYVAFEGEGLDAFAPTLSMGEVVQVGGGTSFGLGRLAIAF